MAVVVVASARPAVAAKHTPKASVPKVFSKEQKLAIAGVAASIATTLAPAAQAAQEVAMTAEGEPGIVQVAWGALAASFSLSLAATVWGRSGL